MMASDFKKMMEEIRPFRDEFHAFLVENEGVAHWQNCSLSYNPEYPSDDYYDEHDEHDEEDDDEDYPEEYLPVSYFTLDITDTQSGISFVAQANDIYSDHEPRNLWFTMPFEYIEDPYGWTKRELTAAAARQSLAENAYDKLAPGAREELKLEIVPLPSHDGKTLHFYFRENGKKDRVFNHPRIERMIANDFTIDAETGEIVDHSVIRVS